MLIKTSDIKSIQPFLDKLYIPSSYSHKGHNGKVLIVGGSSLFHSASIWAAEVASYFVDIVHYCSTEINSKVFLSLKKKFHNGIVVSAKDLDNYAKEDDAILLGPGMLRGESAEALSARKLVGKIITQFPKKQFVLDAGALQMMAPKWLVGLKVKPILTPQSREFEVLFGVKITDKSQTEIMKIVQQTARRHKCIIILKRVVDIISDGRKVYLVEGGNAGLTKGGTGDILAGLAVALSAKNDALTSAVIASFILKKTAEKLFLTHGYWYNIASLLDTIPRTLKELKLR